MRKWLHHVALATIALGAPIASTPAQAVFKMWDSVVVLIPPSVLKTAKSGFTGEIRYEATVSLAYGDSVVTVNGDPKWKSRGPLVRTARLISAIQNDESDGSLVYELKEDGQAEVKLRILGDRTRALAAVIWHADDMETLLRLRVEEQARAIFTASASGLSDSVKVQLTEFVARTMKAEHLSVETVRARPYLTALIPSWVLYNDFRMNQADRTVDDVSTRLVGMLRSWGELLPESTPFYGIALETFIAHKSFLRADPAASDRLQIFVSTASARQFAALELTAQQLLDRSIVLLNGNRIDVALMR